MPASSARRTAGALKPAVAPKPAAARKNPLRVAGDPAPGLSAASLSVATVARPPLRTSYTPREMRQMMISEFADWLGTQTNKQRRPFQQETITAYCAAAEALSS
jgi:hypothetical protein